jgi:rod shape determining protein RodA
MNSKSSSIDWWLMLPVLLLIIFGLTVLSSLVPQQFVYQLVFFVISAIVFFIISQIDYQVFQSLHMPLFVGSIIFLITPFIFGFASRGAHRWLQFGAVSVQPSEIIKPLLLTTFALLAASEIKNKLVWLIGAFALPASIVFFQPDLGTTLVIGMAWIVIFVSLLSPRVVISGILILGLISPLGWNLLKDYQKDRLVTFVNPYHDPLGRGYHVIQSMIAVGSGQLVGRGLGQGTQSQLQFLPEKHTDFVFASIAEDLGFVGAGMVIILLGLIFARMFWIYRECVDFSSRLFVLGSLAMLSFQAFVNIGMNMGMVPVTGITLPFLSYGGSSLLSLSILFGMTNAISCQTRGRGLS